MYLSVTHKCGSQNMILTVSLLPAGAVEDKWLRGTGSEVLHAWWLCPTPESPGPFTKRFGGANGDWWDWGRLKPMGGQISCKSRLQDVRRVNDDLPSLLTGCVMTSRVVVAISRVFVWHGRLRLVLCTINGRIVDVAGRERRGGGDVNGYEGAWGCPL